MISTLSRRMSSWATSAARFGLDWLSLMMISKGWLVPLILIEPPVAFLICSIVNGICSVKKASGPVDGWTRPILMVFGAAKAGRATEVANRPVAATPLTNWRRSTRRSFLLIVRLLLVIA